MLTMIVHAVQCTVYMKMMVICDGYDGYLCKEAEMLIVTLMTVIIMMSKPICVRRLGLDHTEAVWFAGVGGQSCYEGIETAEAT